jgi:hypothetical protein
VTKITVHALVRLPNLEHLVVDEYQDLNPMDIRSVDALATKGLVSTLRAA